MKNKKHYFYYLIYPLAILFIFNISNLSANELENLSLYTLKNFYGENNDGLASFNSVNNKLTLYKEGKNNNLEIKATSTLPQALSNLCVYNENNEKKLILALGLERGKLDAPIKIFLTDKNLSTSKLIYETKSERSDISFLRQVDSDIYVNYFYSRFYSVFGKLTKVTDDKWDFFEIQKVRLGMNVDMDSDNNNVVFARPYKDEENNLSEVILLNKDKKLIELPSFRGARSVAFFDINNDKKQEILIADGWHQDYGKLAENRLSIISFNEKTKKYDLKLIANQKGQPSFEKIIPFSKNNKNYILTVGEKFIDLFEPQNNWKKTRIKEKQGEFGQILDAAVAKFNNKVKIAIFDKKLEINDI